jgi:4-amino-4-deoxy-L-arabinose transferase-like glycosyltransferase
MTGTKSRYATGFWILSAVTALLRLLVIGRIGLSGDEAHYYTYTRYLDLSYFDHPSAIAYLIKASTLIFGQTEFAVRFPAVTAFFVTCVVMFYLTRRLFDERTAFWTVALLNVIPVFSFLGSVLTIPDTPLVVFWIAFVALFWHTVSSGRAGCWYILGALLGLGLLSKYNAVLLVPSALLFLFLAAVPRHRHWLARKEPYLALAIAGLVFLPVVLWNLQNNFASFGFQLRHGFGSGGERHFSFALLGRCLSAQAGYLSPLLFILFWTALGWLLVRSIRAKDERALFIFSFSFPTLFLFNAIAGFNEILPHWPAMGYLVLSIGVADFMLRAWRRVKKCRVCGK